jgi:hypothetical protein
VTKSGDKKFETMSVSLIMLIGAHSSGNCLGISPNSLLITFKMLTVNGSKNINVFEFV